MRVFAGRVKAADQAIERKTFDKLVADLDDPQFRVRGAAEKELLRVAHRIPAAWLRQATAKAATEEQRTRLAKVLALREKPLPAERQLVRAVQALELAGTPEAVGLLKEWAKAPDGSLLAVEAKGALARLAGHFRRVGARTRPARHCRARVGGERSTLARPRRAHHRALRRGRTDRPHLARGRRPARDHLGPAGRDRQSQRQMPAAARGDHTDRRAHRPSSNSFTIACHSAASVPVGTGRCARRYQ